LKFEYVFGFQHQSNVKAQVDRPLAFFFSPCCAHHDNSGSPFFCAIADLARGIADLAQGIVGQRVSNRIERAHLQ